MSEFTPMMKQYFKIKKQYRDCIIFYRVGDFYETFFKDAQITSNLLNIVLTGKDCGQKERAPMAGIPYHAAENYINKLIENGYKVAICEQLEDPSKAKGLVKRDVIRVVTPGTIINDKLIGNKDSNYICSLYMGNEYSAIAALDVSTGETLIKRTSTDEKIIFDEIEMIDPSEILLQEKLATKSIYNRLSDLDKLIEIIPDDYYNYEESKKVIQKQFDNKAIIDRFNNTSIVALAVLIEFVINTLKINNLYLNEPEFEFRSMNLEIDNFTRKNLELLESIKPGKNKDSTLLHVMDKTKTAMGGRLIKKYIVKPIVNIEKITDRLDAVDELYKNKDILQKLRDKLKEVHDIERILSKFNYNSATPRDLIILKTSIKILPDIKKLLSVCKSKLLKELTGKLDTLDDIFKLIDKSINDEPPNDLKDGDIIKDGYNKEIDNLRYMKQNSKKLLIDLEQREKKRTGIKSLKVGYNKVFGYYIEVTSKNIDLVPSNYIRKQTLANCERYITEELKQLEIDITDAEIKLSDLEYNQFNIIRNNIICETKRIQKSIFIISQLDVLQSFAYISIENNYTKPKINNDDRIIIKGGRHPVIEKMYKKNLFIANDVNLNNAENMIHIITGPNMAGKSTYMRQIALIVIMAQMGCFVPADKASLGVVDKIFTRVGASDDISSGQSTFMVEMNEVAYILKNATPRSLIILDEIGRGTSTFDGLSIAWAVVEYISMNIKAKTLFATHYHELVKLEDNLPNVRNYYVSVYKHDDDIVFLRKILSGSMSQSFGIQVAKMAGVPETVIKKAKSILRVLEKGEKKVRKPSGRHTATQLDISNLYDLTIIDTIKNIDINNITPVEALNILYKLKNTADGSDKQKYEQNKNIR